MVTSNQESRTPWTARHRTPARDFLRTESGSAIVLLVASAAALVWANVSASTYHSVWQTVLSVRIDDASVALDLRRWVNSGLMTLFFFVVGLEARREFDVGELREHERVTLPVLAGLAGMVVPVLIYLGFNAGSGATRGWGIAMSTDTAFALGILALVGPRLPGRLRSFMLTVVVVDDFVALVVIAIAYTGGVSWVPIGVAAGVLAVILAVSALKIRPGLVYALLAIVMWVAVLKSGVDPIVVGLVMGLLTYAYPADRQALERATEGFRLFREQPTAEYARLARENVEAAISPNDRLQHLYHPWTSYLIVPLFALANIGIPLNASFVSHAFTSPVTLGVLVGYVAGKPVGILAASSALTWLSRGRFRPPVGWAAVAGAGTIAGIGFTVSLLIASLALDGTQLQQAKLGVLAAAVVSSAVTWGLFRGVAALPMRVRAALLFGRLESIIDLADPVDPERDHIRGPADAAVTLVEYGDLECPYCGRIEASLRQLLDDGDLRYVWRHLPLAHVHPHAQLAAEATEAAALQGKFWELHDLLFEHQDALQTRDLLRYADEAGLDAERFAEDLHAHVGAARVAGDVDSADRSDVAGTPTFFINGRRYHGRLDLAALTTAVRAARARAVIRS